MCYCCIKCSRTMCVRNNYRTVCVFVAECKVSCRLPRDHYCRFSFCSWSLADFQIHVLKIVGRQGVFRIQISILNILLTSVIRFWDMGRLCMAFLWLRMPAGEITFCYITPSYIPTIWMGWRGKKERLFYLQGNVIVVMYTTWSVILQLHLELTQSFILQVLLIILVV